MDHKKDRNLDKHDKSRPPVLQNLTEYMNDHLNHLKKYEEEVPRLLQTMSDEFEQLEKTLQDKQKQLDDTNDRLQRTLNKLKRTKKELDKTKTSKVIDDKLADSNPSIADLSDIQRPTRLAEVYAELYDNQWTDAYEAIERYFNSEEDVIRAILEILMNVMDFCKDKAKRQMEDLLRNLALSEYQEDQNVPDTIREQLKSLRKLLSPTSKQNLYKVYISTLQMTTDQTLRLAMKIEPFVKKCFEICWYMSVQDPPIVLSPLARDGDALNTDIYKPYTRSGSCIQFLVWPALLLHENGPVLAKGVAEGKRELRDTPKLALVENAGISKTSLKDDHSRHIVERDAFVINRSPSSYFQGQNHDIAFSVNKKSTGTGEDRHHRTKSEETKSRNPSGEELRLYFRYMDRRDFVGAMTALGYDVYMECILNKHKRHLYS